MPLSPPVGRQHLHTRRVTCQGFFREDGLRSLIADHQDGRADHSLKIWALLQLELWMRTYIDPAEVPTQPMAVA